MRPLEMLVFCLLFSACTASTNALGGGGGAAGGEPTASDGSVIGASAGEGGSLADGAVGDAMMSKADASRDGSTIDASTPQALCETTGGSVRNTLCCMGSDDFPDNCPGKIGGCGCAPSASVEVMTCDCPDGGCFRPGVGCMGSACTPGQDQTCNDNAAISSLRGTCLANQTCECGVDSAKNPATGRCI